MSELLVPPLAVDDRSRAIDALAARMTGLDLTPILVYLIDLVPADALPYLAEQFNVVGPLWAYLPDEAAKRRAIKESVAWHRAKGTPWSVETALSWAGHVAKVEDTTGSANRWAEYQLELGAPVAGDALQAVLKLARVAAPARSHLVRLYGSYDRRVSTALAAAQALQAPTPSTALSLTRAPVGSADGRDEDDDQGRLKMRSWGCEKCSDPVCEHRLFTSLRLAATR